MADDNRSARKMADLKQYRRCPGEKYDITVPVCKGRQRRSYPKCMVCLHRTIVDTALQPGKSMEEADIFKSYD
ncbi:MAG TPA: hypothetical protein VI387_11855, partial [Candidatus Brocadiales bacterium]|nr:hypothetical protein [Candidatus Brocadiales bacterium]